MVCLAKVIDRLQSIWHEAILLAKAQLVLRKYRKNFLDQRRPQVYFFLGDVLTFGGMIKRTQNAFRKKIVRSCAYHRLHTMVHVSASIYIVPGYRGTFISGYARSGHCNLRHISVKMKGYFTYGMGFYSRCEVFDARELVCLKCYKIHESLYFSVLATSDHFALTRKSVHRLLCLKVCCSTFSLRSRDASHFQFLLL